MSDELTHSWRRVASTSELSVLLYKSSRVDVGRGHLTAGTKKITRRAAGLLLCFLAACLLLLTLAYAVAVFMPHGRLPSVLAHLRARSDLMFRVSFAFHATAIGVLLHWFSLKLFRHNSS